VLNPDEIQLIKAVYSRTVVSLGNEKFLPNVGVAQGSGISPCLFNIYAELLLVELQMNGWRIDDLLGFADDYIILCLTKGMLRKAIEAVRDWCSRANIKLNLEKSGILEIVPKGLSQSFVGNKFEGVPVVSEYKYLGLVLDNKVNGSKHTDKLFGFRDENGKKQRGKIKFLKYNLSPLLKDISVDYRVNLWQILVRPLFLPLALLKNFLCKSTAEEIKRKLQKSLKWFLGLARNTPDEVVFSLFNPIHTGWSYRDFTQKI